MRRPSQAGAATASCGGNTGYEEGEQQQQQSGEEEQEEEEEEELESFSDDEAQAPMQVHVGHVHGATARNAGTSYGTAVRGFGEGSSTVAGGGSGGRRWIQAWRDNNNDDDDDDGDDDDGDDDGDVDEIDSSNDDTAVEECRLITPEGQEDRPPVMKSSTCGETPSSVASTVAFSDDEPSDLGVSPAAAGVTVAGGIQRVGLAGLARQR